jgi:hypothetical protein
MIESIKNEYETKIYDLNDDINILNKRIKQYELSLALCQKYEINNEDLELIQELKEANKSLISQLNASESQIHVLNEKNGQLENQLDEKERQIEENEKLLGNYQKEVIFKISSI